MTTSTAKLSTFFFFVSFFCLSSLSHSFSLGTMDVKSRFGEKFLAEVNLIHDPKQPVDVGIGKTEHYERLQIKRERWVEQLYIRSVIDLSESEKIVRIVSDRPLFYPSFYLAIMAKQGEGTLIENYLVSVDFQKSITLSAMARKSRTPFQDQSVEKPSLFFSDTVSKKQPRFKEEISPDPSFEQQASLPRFPASPLIDSKVESIPRVKVRPLPRPQAETVKHLADQQKTEPPLNKAIFSIARTNPSINSNPSEKKPDPTDGMSRTNGISNTLRSIRVGPGDNLLSLTSKLPITANLASQVAVAIWTDNQDKFIDGNIHGLIPNSKLDLTLFRKRLKLINETRARWVLENHWQEWKMRIDAIAHPIPTNTVSAQVEMSYPKNFIKTERLIKQVVSLWKKSWEERDFDFHLALFSSTQARGGIDYWRRFKKRMFKRHKSPRLTYSEPLILFLNQKVRVIFLQEFESRQMKSVGLKTLELIDENGDWKIIHEFFKPEKVIHAKRFKSGADFKKTTDFNTPFPSPLVVQASVSQDLSDAISKVNELKKIGFRAYHSPLFVDGETVLYRILVGRFSNLPYAESVTRFLRSTKNFRFAAPKGLAFSLAVKNLDETDDTIKQLLEKNFSSYSHFSSQKIIDEQSVLVGAFFKRKAAKNLAKKLNQAGFESETVTP